jgi:dTMP kinase
MRKGYIIEIDGYDGVGKSTQVDLVYEKLKNLYPKTIKMKFPNYSKESSLLVKEYLSGNIYKEGPKDSIENIAKGVSMLYMVDRHINMYGNNNRLIQLLEEGYIILCDRYSTANTLLHTPKIYNEYKDTNKVIDFIRFLNKTEHEVLKVPKADITIIMKSNVDHAISSLNKKENKDILEKEEYQRMCYNFFNYLMTIEELKDITSKWNIVNCFDQEAGDLYSKDCITSILMGIIRNTILINLH